MVELSIMDKLKSLPLKEMELESISHRLYHAVFISIECCATELKNNTVNIFSLLLNWHFEYILLQL